MSAPKEYLQNEGILSSEEKILAKKLFSLNQGHLFSKWEVAGTNDSKKHEFLKQVGKNI